MSPRDPNAHLSALALDAAALGEALPAAQQAHLQGCDACQQRLGEVRAFDAGLDLRPPAFVAPAAVEPAPAVAPVVSLDAVRRRRMRLVSGGAAVLALAAALLLMTRGGPTQLATDAGPLEQPDVLRARGGDALSAFDVALFAKAEGAAEVRRVGEGDAVAAGERLRFRLTLPGAVHVAILGIDSAGTVYRCHPQGEGDELAEHHGAGAPAAATEVEIDDTIAFDDAGEAERIVAIACPGPRSLRSLQAALGEVATAEPLPTLAEDCVQRTVRLRKQPAAGTDAE